MARHDASLLGELVILEPLDAEHVPALLQISRSAPDAFKLTSTPITDLESEAYFSNVFNQQAAGSALAFAIRHQRTGQVVGTTRMTDLDSINRRCSIGHTWLNPVNHGDGSNLDSKYLLLRHAFERLEFNRVQFQVDERNTPSCRALQNLGAHEEGRLRFHMLSKDGTFRTTVIYSIVGPEWPSVKTNLERRIRAKAGSRLTSRSLR